MSKTASGSKDYHSDCPCRQTDELCRKCYNFGLRIVMAQGLSQQIRQIADKERSLERVAFGYLRSPGRWKGEY